MKNKFLLLIISLLVTQFLMAQNKARVSDKLREMNNDTVKYVKEYILLRKDFYIGKSLDSLLKDLPLPVIEYVNGDVPRNRSICPATSLLLFSYQERTNKIIQKENPLTVVIKWATPLDNNELPGLGLRIWGGEWTLAAYNYYKNKIIGNVEMGKYNF
jgi:hypothetical protein